jgi:hypothetical protein
VTASEAMTTLTLGPFLHVLPFFRAFSSFSLSNSNVLGAFRYWSRSIRPVSVSESDGYGFAVHKDILGYHIRISILLLNKRNLDKPWNCSLEGFGVGASIGLAVGRRVCEMALMGGEVLGSVGRCLKRF